MLQQIIQHTPLYVWAILAFLITRGVNASRDRELSLRTLFIIPLVMLALSMSSVAGAFPASMLAMTVWVVSVLAFSALGWFLLGATAHGADPARGVIQVRGSWAPLATMMLIFCTKYALAVTFATVPALRQDPTCMVATSILYGAFSGYFIARLARAVAVYRHAVKQAAHCQTEMV